MFERFTEHAKRVTMLAKEEASRAGLAAIGPDQLFVGVLTDDGGAGFRLLQQLGVDVADLRDQLRKQTGGGAVSPPELPFTAQAKKALELSLREAIRLGDHCIGSEHLVLGLLREGNSEGSRILGDRGIAVPEAEAGLAFVARESLPPANPAEPGGGRWWRRRR